MAEVLRVARGCLLLALSRHPLDATACPLSRVKQTCGGDVRMSDFDPRRSKTETTKLLKGIDIREHGSHGSRPAVVADQEGHAQAPAASQGRGCRRIGRG